MFTIRRRLSLLVFVLLARLGFALAIEIITPKYVIELLESFYNSTNGLNWDYDSMRAEWPYGQASLLNGAAWNFSKNSMGDYLVNPCAQETNQTTHFAGIICECSSPDPTHFPFVCNITELALPNANLAGRLPDALFDLTTLTTLSLYSNRISGSIPPLIKNLIGLEYLELGANLLTSSIPSQIGDLYRLSFLDLFKNLLSGIVPTELTKTNLSQCYLSENMFSGAFPSFFGEIRTLTHLYLNNNSFSGSLSENIGNLSLLSELILHDNQLSSSLPASLGRLTNLVQLHVGQNSFVSIPQSVAQLANLRVLILSRNLFSGPLDFLDPTQQKSLSVVDIASNAFSGTLPESIFESLSLTDFIAANNCFEGSLPSSICNAQNMENLVLNGLTSGRSCRRYFFAGTVFENVFNGGTTDNFMAGRIPSCLYTMPRLRSFFVLGNNLNGEFPREISKSLEIISASRNRISGSLVNLFTPNSRLNSMDVGYNRISGRIDALSSFDNSNHAANFSALYLQANRLVGVIPAALVNLAPIKVLRGNLFDCDEPWGLPLHDPDARTFRCGSRALNIILVASLILSALYVCAWLSLKYFSRFQRLYRVAHKWATIADADSNILKAIQHDMPRIASDPGRYLQGMQFDTIKQYTAYLQDMKQFCSFFSVILAIFLVLYLSLSGGNNRIIAVPYLFVTTAAYLTGTASVFCMFGSVMLTIGSVSLWIHLRGEKNSKDKLRGDFRLSHVERTSTGQTNAVTTVAVSSDAQREIEVYSGSESDSDSDEHTIASVEASFHTADHIPPMSPTREHVLRGGERRLDSGTEVNSTSKAILGRSRGGGLNISNPSVSTLDSKLIEELEEADKPGSSHSSYCAQCATSTLIPMLRLAVLMIFLWGVIVVVNVMYLIVERDGTVSQQSNAKIAFALFKLIWTLSVTPALFESERLYFGVCRQVHERFVRKVFGGHIAVLFFLKAVPQFLIPIAVASCFIQTCFKEVFVARQNIPYAYDYSSCVGYIVGTNECANTKTIYVQDSVFVPFVYDNVCSNDILRAYVPLYVQMAVILLLKSAFHYVYLIWDSARYSDSNGEDSGKHSASGAGYAGDPEYASAPAHISVAGSSKSEFQPAKPVGCCKVVFTWCVTAVRRLAMKTFPTKYLMNGNAERREHFVPGKLFPSKMNVWVTKSISGHLVLVLLLITVGVAAPLFGFVLIFTMRVEMYASQMILGRFIWTELAAIEEHYASNPSEQNDKGGQSEGGGARKREEMRCSHRGIDASHVRDAVAQPWGALAALKALESQCSHIPHTALRQGQSTYVFLPACTFALLLGDEVHNGTGEALLQTQRYAYMPYLLLGIPSAFELLRRVCFSRHADGRVWMQVWCDNFRACCCASSLYATAPTSTPALALAPASSPTKTPDRTSLRSSLIGEDNSVETQTTLEMSSKLSLPSRAPSAQPRGIALEPQLHDAGEEENVVANPMR